MVNMALNIKSQTTVLLPISQQQSTCRLMFIRIFVQTGQIEENNFTYLLRRLPKEQHEPKYDSVTVEWCRDDIASVVDLCTVSPNV